MFVIQVPYFSLDHIYNSGQAPRWIKLKESHYIIPHEDKALKIQQQKDRLIMNCSENDFYNIWFNYFDLQTDYCLLNNDIKRLGGKFKKIAVRGCGIHILNQNEFETYVFSKLIENVGWIKAKELMNRIAQTYGVEHVQSMREAGRVTWYEWPTPELMLEKLNQEKQSSGKVKPFLKKLCDAIVYKYYAYTCPDNWNDVCKLLMGNKNVFPIVDIEKTLEKNFNCTPEEFESCYLDDLKNKGLVYAYVLHHIMNPPKEATLNGLNR